MKRFWENLTWGPLYFVRRAACRVLGHRWKWDTSAPPHEYFCSRCMENA